MHYQYANTITIALLLNLFITFYKMRKGLVLSHFFSIMQNTSANFRNIKFRPEEFQEILLDKVCFKYFRNDILKSAPFISIPFVLPIYLLQFCLDSNG